MAAHPAWYEAARSRGESGPWGRQRPGTDSPGQRQSRQGDGAVPSGTSSPGHVGAVGSHGARRVEGRGHAAHDLLDAVDGQRGSGGDRFNRDGRFIDTTRATEFTDTGLTPLTTYTYTVEAFDYRGNVSEPSRPLQVTTTAPAPAFVQVSYAVRQSPATTVSATYGGRQTAGDTNILAVGWNDTTSRITSVTDSAGNVYQLALPSFRGNGLSQAIFYAASIFAAPPGARRLR